MDDLIGVAAGVLIVLLPIALIGLSRPIRYAYRWAAVAMAILGVGFAAVLLVGFVAVLQAGEAESIIAYSVLCIC
jgi:hypothetical protein